MEIVHLDTRRQTAREIIWRRCVEWIRRNWRSRPERKLRLCETLALGDRQFLSVVRFDQQSFLIGRTHTSLHLLAELPGTGPSSARREPASSGDSR